MIEDHHERGEGPSFKLKLPISSSHAEGASTMYCSFIELAE